MPFREYDAGSNSTIEITPVSRSISTPETKTTTYTRTVGTHKAGETVIKNITPTGSTISQPEPIVNQPDAAAVMDIIQQNTPSTYNVIQKIRNSYQPVPSVKIGAAYTPPKIQNLTRDQLLKKVYGYNPRIQILLTNLRELRGYTKTNKMNMYSFRNLHPEVAIPSSKYGSYDVVTVKTVKEPGRSGGTREYYVFDYSSLAKHKIKIAGSVENYDAYLDIVRSHPELAALHAFAGPLNIDLALASNKPGITGASEREEILIKQLHSWKGSPTSKGDLGRMGKAIIENPFVQIAASEAIGVGFGKVLGGSEGYIATRFGPKALQAFNLSQVAVGGALAAPGVYSAGKKISEGKTGEGVGELAMFALLFGAGIEGYRIGKGTPKSFGKYKGLTPYEAGAKRGMIKSKRFDPLQKEYFNLLTDIKQDLRLRKVMPEQVEPTFENVEALKTYNKERADLLRTAVKNQLVALKSKAQISGGAGTEKVSTHDIDTLFRSAKDPVVLEYIARKLGIDPNMVFDPHQLPRSGDIITRFGAAKETGYKYPSGSRGIRLTEQFYRLGESSMELAHKGRVKDIPEAIRVLDLIYSKTGGIPQKMMPKVQRFVEIAAIFQQDPRIMDPAMSKLLYDSGISQKLWNVRTKFYRKVLPETYLNKQFNALTNKDLNLLQNFLQARSGGLPPGLSMSFSSGYGSSGFAAFASSFLSNMPGYPSTYPGGSRSIGSRPSNSPSNVGSGSGSSGRSSNSNRGSGRSGSGSRPYIPGDVSSYFGSGSNSYVSRSKSSKSPPPPSNKYSPPPPSEYYPPPPSSDYYPSPYGSSIWYPSTPIIKPGPFLPIPMGGKVGSKGRVGPYGVKYYDEYEALQRLMQDVIF